MATAARADVVCAGWLKKLGFGSGKWQDRYVMLTPAALFYHSEVGGKPKGEVAVPRITSVGYVSEGGPIPREACIVVARKPIDRFSFKVTATEHSGVVRTYIFTAPSKADADMWVRWLTAAKDGRLVKRHRVNTVAATKPSAPSDQGAASSRDRAATAGSKATVTFHSTSQSAAKYDVKKLAWYEPDWTTDQANSFVEAGPTGTFVIRKAPDRAGAMALTVNVGSKAGSLLLQRRKAQGKTWYQLGSSKDLFEHLVDLVFYYCEHGVVKNAQGMVVLNLAGVRQARQVFEQQEAAEEQRVDDAFAAFDEAGTSTEESQPAPPQQQQEQDTQSWHAELEALEAEVSAMFDRAVETSQKLANSSDTYQTVRATFLQARDRISSEWGRAMTGLQELGRRAMEAVQGKKPEASSEVEESVKTVEADRKRFDDDVSDLELSITSVDEEKERGEQALSRAEQLKQTLRTTLDNASQAIRKGMNPGPIRMYVGPLLQQLKEQVDASRRAAETIEGRLREVEKRLQETVHPGQVVQRVEKRFNDLVFGLTGGDDEEDEDGQALPQPQAGDEALPKDGQEEHAAQVDEGDAPASEAEGSGVVAAQPHAMSMPESDMEAEAAAPVTEDGAPITEDVAPVTEDVAPVTEDVAPVTEDGGPAADSPAADKPPTAEDDSKPSTTDSPGVTQAEGQPSGEPAASTSDGVTEVSAEPSQDDEEVMDMLSLGAEQFGGVTSQAEDAELESPVADGEDDIKELSDSTDGLVSSADLQESYLDLPDLSVDTFENPDFEDAPPPPPPGDGAEVSAIQEEDESEMSDSEDEAGVAGNNADKDTAASDAKPGSKQTESASEQTPKEQEQEQQQEKKEEEEKEEGQTETVDKSETNEDDDDDDDDDDGMIDVLSPAADPAPQGDTAKDETSASSVPAQDEATGDEAAPGADDKEEAAESASTASRRLSGDLPVPAKYRKGKN